MSNIARKESGTSRRDTLDVMFVTGPPGAGKTSACEAYERDHPGVAQFGTGELVWGISAGRYDSMYASVLREAAEKQEQLPSEIFSLVVHEKIMQLGETAETVLVTSFPYDYPDWTVFNEIITGTNVRAIGSVVFSADLDTCIARMQERDIKKGIDGELTNTHEARIAYEERYLGLMARLAIRLDCYKQSGLGVVSISALQTRDVVLSEFSDALVNFKDKRG